MPTPKYELSNLTLDEVSLVDHGANQEAHVVLFKRAGMQEPQLEKSNGIHYVIGFREDNSTALQSVRFGKEWTQELVMKWLGVNTLGKSDEITKSTAGLTLTRHSITGFKKTRTITPGPNTIKALNADDSFMTLQTCISEALQAKFGGKVSGDGASITGQVWPWLKDMFMDNVIMELSGECYRVPYTVDRDSSGDMHVTLGDKVPVEVVYVDEIVGKQEPKKIANFDQLRKLGQMQAKAKLLNNNLSKLSTELASASIASHKARAASQVANAGRSVNAHDKAADLHGVAAALNVDAGKTNKADEHKAAQRFHNKQSKLITESRS